MHTADCFDNSQAWADRGPTVEVHCCVSPAHSRTKRNHSSPSSSSVRPMVRRGLLLRCRARRDPHRRPPASEFSADTPEPQLKDPSCGMALCARNSKGRKQRQVRYNNTPFPVSVFSIKEAFIAEPKYVYPFFSCFNKSTWPFKIHIFANHTLKDLVSENVT